MAITQISRIQHRRGLKESLPQLSAGEFGWAVDTQELFIGNGTVADGAPETGNTKIITEDDNILTTSQTYTLRGNADSPIVTGVDSNAPIVRTLQQKIDDFVNIKDFGAVGNGVTDDTAAINRAITNTFDEDIEHHNIRKIYVPGGVYIVNSGTIKILPHTKLVGDGPEASVFRLTDSSQNKLMETADSQGHTGADIGSGGAEKPQDINIQNIGFDMDSKASGIIISQAEHINFDACAFNCTYTQQAGLTEDPVGLIEIKSTNALQTKQINFTNCQFTKSEYGVVIDDDVQDVLFLGCEFNIMFRAFNLGEASDGSTVNKIDGPSGILIEGCRFDKIDAEAVKIYDAGGTPDGNIVTGSSFRDVGANSDDSAELPCIQFDHANNFAYGNYFHRPGKQADIGGNAYYETPINNSITLSDNQTAVNLVDPFTSEAVQIDNQNEPTVFVEYQIKRGTNFRIGKLTITSTVNDVQFSDEFTENGAVGVTLSVLENGTVQYATTSTGSTATFKHRILYYI
tara:strand:+ start:290 stop:1834 length:1545 start_codon:yes stop_codon:yes gene_type:complete